MPTLKQVRSAITRGSVLLPGVDGRSAWLKRLSDLVASYTSDLGGEDAISEAERALIRRIAMMQLQLELQEVRFGQSPDGAAAPKALHIYVKASGALNRLCKSIGLRRRPRDVTPDLDAYLEAHPAKKRGAPKRVEVAE